MAACRLGVLGLRQKQGTLTIIDKRGRGEILKSERGKLEGNLSLDDIDKFQDVGQIL